MISDFRSPKSEFRNPLPVSTPTRVGASRPLRAEARPATAGREEIRTARHLPRNVQPDEQPIRTGDLHLFF